jgi:hypothetical protein
MLKTTYVPNMIRIPTHGVAPWTSIMREKLKPVNRADAKVREEEEEKKRGGKKMTRGLLMDESCRMN